MRLENGLKEKSIHSVIHPSYSENVIDELIYCNENILCQGHMLLWNFFKFKDKYEHALQVQ